MQTTHIVMILDESGSMGPQRNDVIGGYGEFMRIQQEAPEPTLVTRVKFNTVYTVDFAGLTLSKAAAVPLGYSPSGGTALFDAVAAGVKQAEKEKADKYLVVVMTDGQENSSRETTMEQLKELMAAKEKEGNWTFAYLGVEPEAWSHAMGTPSANTMSYDRGQTVSQMAHVSSMSNNLKASGRGQSMSFFEQDAVSDAAKVMGKAGGKKGGKAAAEALTPEERTARAIKAAKGRWEPKK